MYELYGAIPGDFEKHLFCVIWVGNILKPLICYIPLVFKCHFIAKTATFEKIMKIFKKSDFFFVFEKFLFGDAGKS